MDSGASQPVDYIYKLLIHVGMATVDAGIDNRGQGPDVLLDKVQRTQYKMTGAGFPAPVTY